MRQRGGAREGRVGRARARRRPVSARFAVAATASWARTCERMQSTHIPAGLGGIPMPHMQHRTCPGACCCWTPNIAASSPWCLGEGREECGGGGSRRRFSSPTCMGIIFSVGLVLANLPGRDAIFSLNTQLSRGDFDRDLPIDGSVVLALFTHVRASALARSTVVVHSTGRARVAASRGRNARPSRSLLARLEASWRARPRSSASRRPVDGTLAVPSDVIRNPGNGTRPGLTRH